MPVFRYRTLQASGAVVEGEVEAIDQQAAVARLQAGGTYPITVEATTGLAPSEGETALVRRGAKLSSTELALLSTTLLLAFVVPRFEALLRDLNRELPPATRFLLFLSQFVQDWGPWLALAACAGVAWFVWRLREDGFRRAVDQRVLKLPFIGPLLLKIEPERFGRLF